MENLSLKAQQQADIILRPGSQNITQNCSASELNHLAERIFTHPTGWSDKVFRSPFVFAAEYLIANGVSKANIRAGLLSILAMNSVRLRNPTSIVLRAEETAVASHLLTICKQIAPKNSFVEVRNLKAEQLYASPNFFRNKILICDDITSIKKALPDLLSIITQGRAARQCEFKSKFGSGIQSFTAEYKVAFIGVENSTAESLINHPSVIKVPVCGGGHTQIYSESGQLSESGNYTEKIGGRCIATQFERLAPRRVSIPYFDRVVRVVMDEKPAHLKMKLSVIKKTIDLCAIIHDPPEMSGVEMFLRTIGIVPSGPQKLAEATKALAGYLPVLSDILNANIADYYIVKILLNDLLDVDNQSFTNKQVKVFEVIKGINFGKLLGAVIDQDDTIEKLALLPRFPKYWAYMHEIMKGVNKGRSEFMSGPDIEDIIRSLKKHKKVGAKKSQATGDHGYFTLVPKIDGRLKLPSVSKIKESHYFRNTVKVLNPITGEIKKI